jgi:Domain of unknown function (DUF3291)
MPIVSITRLRVRSWRYLPMFMWYASRSSRQAAKARGSLAVRLLKDRRKTFWTGTVWTTDAAMKTFMLAGTHREAMRKLPHWCDEASVVHWNQESGDLPTWPEASARLQNEGRRSKVNQPSGAHMAHKFPKPRVARTSDFRLK